MLINAKFLLFLEFLKNTMFTTGLTVPRYGFAHLTNTWGSYSDHIQQVLFELAVP